TRGPTPATRHVTPGGEVRGVAMMNAFFDALGNLLVSIRVLGSSGAPTGLRSPDTFKKVQAVAITAGTPVSVWAPATGKKFRLMGYCLSSSGAASAIIFEDATGA